MSNTTNGVNQPPAAVFRSIETVDPTTIAVYRDRLVLSRGDRGEVRVVALQDIGKVRVRTLFGVSTILVRTPRGTFVADLFAREEAEAARAAIEELRDAPAAIAVPDEAAPAA